MERFDPSPNIRNSHLITDIYGIWPYFHDAEIKDLALSVADGKPWEVGSVSPTLSLVLHAFEMTKEVNSEGHFVLRHHNLISFEFESVRDLSFSDFWHQNVLFELEFGIEPMTYRNGGGPLSGPPPNVLTVVLCSSFGLTGEFKCISASVKSVVPCDKHGVPC